VQVRPGDGLPVMASEVEAFRGADESPLPAKACAPQRGRTRKVFGRIDQYRSPTARAQSPKPRQTNTMGPEFVRLWRGQKAPRARPSGSSTGIQPHFIYARRLVGLLYLVGRSCPAAFRGGGATWVFIVHWPCADRCPVHWVISGARRRSPRPCSTVGAQRVLMEGRRA